MIPGMLLILLNLQILTTVLFHGTEPLGVYQGDPLAAMPRWLPTTVNLHSVRLPQLPQQDLPRYATLEELGFGGTGWLRVEEDRPGTCWWLRVGGQPVARFEVLLHEPGRAFGKIEPLAEGVRIVPGMQFQRWYRPDSKQLTTAVSFADPRQPLVFVALPPHFPASGQRVTFAGTAAQGILEQRDAFFGQVRLSSASRREEVSPGAPAVIRGGASRGRVFDPGEKVAYVDLGRIDQLTVGLGGWAEDPGGERVAIEVTQVRDAYARVRCPRRLGKGWTVYFGPQPSPEPEMRVVRTLGEGLAICRGAAQVTAGQAVLFGDGRQVLGVGQALQRTPQGDLVLAVLGRYSLRTPQEGDLVRIFAPQSW